LVLRQRHCAIRKLSGGFHARWHRSGQALGFREASGLSGAGLHLGSVLHASARCQHRLGVAAFDRPFAERQLRRHRMGDHRLHAEFCLAADACGRTGRSLRTQETVDHRTIGLHLRIAAVRGSTRSHRADCGARASGRRRRDAALLRARHIVARLSGRSTCAGFRLLGLCGRDRHHQWSRRRRPDHTRLRLGMGVLRQPADRHRPDRLDREGDRRLERPRRGAARSAGRRQLRRRIVPDDARADRG